MHRRHQPRFRHSLDLGVIRIVFGDSPWFQLVRLLVFVGVPLVMAQRLWLQVKAQRDNTDRHDR